MGLASAPTSAVDDLVLSAPTTRLTEVLPLHTLDGIEVPEFVAPQPAKPEPAETEPAKPTPKPAPIRVATRPKLDWRPALKEASEELAPERAKLRPVTELPQLVAPQQAGDRGATTPAEQPAKEARPEPSAKEPTEPAETGLLPLLAPRTDATRSDAEPPQQRASSRPEPDAQEPAPTEPAVKKTDKKPEAETDKADKPTTKTPAAAPAQPVKPPAPLSRSLRNLRSRMRTVLSFYYRQPLNTVEHDPWEIMHSMLSYELHSRIRDGGPRASYMTAVGHLCFNRPSKRQQLMRLTPEGVIDAPIGVGLQGHRGQFLAMLAQCNVSPEYPLRVDGEEFTIRDLIEAEKKTCESDTELTFKLIGLGHYLESDARWVADSGETWDFPRLMREERAQPIRGAACGGTHRLAGLSLAWRRREARGEPIDGEYAEAAKFVSQYQGYAFRLQNQDGSLSTEWFRGPGDEEDIDRRLRTTGHLLEWLVYSLPDDQLTSQRMVRAANYLTNLLAGNADHEWHLGSLPHGLHALVLYDKRVFRPHDQSGASQIAGAVDPTGSLYRKYPIYRGVMRNSPPEPSGLFGIFGGTRTGSAATRRH